MTDVAAILAGATRAAAAALTPLIGSSNGSEIDAAAVEAIRRALRDAQIHGTVRIGEGEKDNAPMLSPGETLGAGGPKLDIAVDPVDGTSAVATGADGAISALAAAPSGAVRALAGDFYLDRLVVSADAKSALSEDCFEVPLGETIKTIAAALGKSIGELRVAVLDRERNQQAIQIVESAGSIVLRQPIADLAASVAVVVREAPVDVLVGIGGAPETVIAAAAVVALGGELIWRRPGDISGKRAHELVGERGLAFAATAVTDSVLLQRGQSILISSGDGYTFRSD